MSHLWGEYHALVTTEERYPAHVQAMLRLRKQLFVDHCGWLLTTTGDVERDQFDVWYTEHCLLFLGSELIGGFRVAATPGKSAASVCCRVRPPHPQRAPTMR